MITARENILRAYRHEKPEWVPSQVLDQNTCLPSCVPEGPAGFGTTVDAFGVSWTFEKGMPGPMVTVGTKLLEDINDWREVIKFPDPKTYDWEGGAAKDTANWDRENKIQSVIIVDGLFEQLHAMTGIEDALCYLLTDEEETESLLTAIADYRIEEVKLIAKYYKPDKIQMHDDYGSNNRMFMSLDTWRDMIKPQLKRIIDEVHAQGMLYEHHSCGYVAPMIEDFMELGIDGLNPLQLTNNPYELKKKYGDRLCFVGGFDNQGILDREGATYQERYDEIMYRIKLMAPGGGWVAHPTMIDPTISEPLIDALYEYNAPLWKKAGYNPPPKPGSLKKTVYAQADTEKTK